MGNFGEINTMVAVFNISHTRYTWILQMQDGVTVVDTKPTRRYEEVCLRNVLHLQFPCCGPSNVTMVDKEFVSFHHYP